MILISIASRQIWPQVLSVAHLQPARVILLHSNAETESRKPAERIQRLFQEAGLVRDGTHLELIPHDDFSAIEACFDEIVARHQLNLADCVVNFTGGNKLMATAVFRRVARRGVRAFYLERGNQITWFEPRDGDLLTHTEPLPARITDALDPAALLCCQFGDEAVQFKGERLTLNAKGRSVNPQDLAAKLRGTTRLDQGGFDFRKWLTVENPAGRLPNEGDNLEYGTACALLMAGVPTVRRSVELATLPTSRNSEGELDLVFNRNGRLWVVDCKDRVGTETKLETLRTALLAGGTASSRVEGLLKGLEEDLRDRDIKTLREDLLQVSEVGGLLGCALAVRSQKPPQAALEFAASRHPKVDVVLKDDLVKRLPALLKAQA